MSLQDPTPHPTSRPPITPILPPRSGPRSPSRAIRLFSKLPRPTPVCPFASLGLPGPSLSLVPGSAGLLLCPGPPWFHHFPYRPLPNANLPVADLVSMSFLLFPRSHKTSPVIPASLYSHNSHQTPTRQSTWWVFYGVARPIPQFPFYPTQPSVGML